MKPTPSALKWLAEKRARVANELTQTQAVAKELTEKVKELEQDLAALDRSLRVYDQRIDPSSIEPVNGWQGNYGKRGALRMFILDALERRYPEWLSSDIISSLVIAHFGLSFAVPAVRKHWYSGTFRSTLKKLNSDGLVELDTPADYHEGNPSRWRFKGEDKSTLAALEQSATRVSSARAPAQPRSPA